MSRAGRIGLVLASVAVLGAACGPAMVWQKPGGNEAQTQADERECRALAGTTEVSPLSSSSTIGGYGVSSGSTMSLRPYPQDTGGAASLQVFWRCMEDRGYHEAPVSGG